MKVKKDICLVCGRKRLGECEGRIIDGSWPKKPVASYKVLPQIFPKFSGRNFNEATT
jgi:hypothetical protein